MGQSSAGGKSRAASVVRAAAAPFASPQSFLPALSGLPDASPMAPSPLPAPAPAPAPAPPVPVPEVAPPPPPAPPPPAAPAAPPASLPERLTALAAAPALSGATVGFSAWVDGRGEIAALGADLPLIPASNQKLFTAAAALSLLPPSASLLTEVRAVGPVDGGTLTGDLVLVGGGDPTLRNSGPHSLDDLAAAVRAGGIERVTGSLLGDETRYDDQRAAPGWVPGDMPVQVGPLSALVVDRNQHRGDGEFAANPVVGNLLRFRAALNRHGVAVLGPHGAGRAPAESVVVASVSSPPIEALVTRMLTDSDNLAAELLLKEIGFRVKGGGTTANGISAADELLRPLGLEGVSADGSGLSRTNLRSARQWRLLLEAVLTQPWGPRLADSLPLASRTGTLVRRFAGTAGEANVRAKTGAIHGVRALSGYLTTAGGRRAVFSVIVNGPALNSSTRRAIDDLVGALAADRS